MVSLHQIDKPSHPVPPVSKYTKQSINLHDVEYARVPNEDLDDNNAELESQVLPQPLSPVSLYWIYILSIASFGVGLSWSFHAVWVAGPVSGLIVAPVVGSLSDNCTSRFGRRRPFIVAGLVATIFGMLTFPHANDIASLFVTGGSRLHGQVALGIGVVTFWILDFAINITMWPEDAVFVFIVFAFVSRKIFAAHIVQLTAFFVWLQFVCGFPNVSSCLTPVRALQGDLVPKEQQHLVQSATMVMSSLGDLSANAIVHSFEEPIKQIRLIFLITAVLYAVTVTTILCIGRETPISTEEHTRWDTGISPFNVFAHFHNLPSWLWRIGGTFSLGFFCFFCVLPYASSWIASSVLGGDPNAADGSKEARLFEKGINLYGRAGVLRSVVQIFCCAIYPKLLDLGASPKQLISGCFICFSSLILIYANTRNAFMAQLAVVLYALPNSSLLTIPIGLTVALSDDSNRGRHLGALNVFAVVPQLIDTGYNGFLSRAFGEAGVMIVGAVWGILTAIGACFLIKDEY